jgi:hypothetical protein
MFCYNNCVSNNISEFLVLISVLCIPEGRYASVAIKLSGSIHGLIFDGIELYGKFLIRLQCASHTK